MRYSITNTMRYSITNTMRYSITNTMSYSITIYNDAMKMPIKSVTGTGRMNFVL